MIASGRALTTCWRNVLPPALACTVTLPAATLAMYATPSALVDTADELGAPPTLYFTVPAGLLATVAPAIGVPAQFFTTTPMNPSPATGVTPAAPATKANSELVINSTPTLSFAT